ncbi:nucleic acid-binding protein [Flagelloscypha sp. PMI_526]|nr:nucleic acid-binding protein [Flagelloscypha sp. PMI_526]
MSFSSRIDSLIKESKSKSKKSKTKTRESETSTKSKLPRIDQLSYKKMTIGTRILGKIVSVQSLALVVSLPNQLYGHIPITNISSQYTALLEKVDEMEEDEEEESEGLIAPIPSLQDLFTSGQFVRTVVSAVGSDISDHTGLSKSRDEIARLSRKVELSLIPERQRRPRIYSGPRNPKVFWFPRFKRCTQNKAGEPVRFWVGQLVNVIISKVKGNGKTCNVTEITRAEAILPGSLVQCLITAVQPFDRITGLDESEQDAAPQNYPVGATMDNAAITRIDHERGMGSSLSTDSSNYPSRNQCFKQTFLRLEDLKVGQVVKGKVKSFKGHWLNPARKFQEGASIKARVLAVDIQRKRLSLTCKKTLLDTELPILSQLSDVKVGIVTHAVVFKIKEKSASVEFFGTLQGVLPAVEVSEDRNVKINEALSIGKVVKVKVIAVDRQNERITRITAKSPSAQIRVALKPGEQLKDLVVVSRNPDKGIVILANKPQDKKSKQTKTSLTMESAQIGQTVIARVMKHLPHAALLKITSSLGAILYRTDVSDDFSKNAELPAIGSTVKGVVVSIDVTLRQLALSTRQSKLDLEKADVITDKEFVTLQDLQPEQALRGFVKQVAQSGLFVLVGRNITVRVQIRELFDEYVKDWQTHVFCWTSCYRQVLDSEKNQVEFTLRSDHVRRSEAAKAQDQRDCWAKSLWEQFPRLSSFGLFVHIDNTKLSGLCHFSDEKDGDYAAALSGFRVGDRVKALVLKVENGSMDIDEEDGEELGEEAEDEEASDDEDEPLDHPIDGQEEPNTSEEDEASNDDEPKAIGFNWSVANEPEDIVMSEPPSDDSEEEATHSKKKKRKVIDQDLTADLDKTVPESNSDFERVLLSSYNSSFLWIKYMSFQLQLSEVDKAREIARRAIRTINIREEQERLNVWIALLNLENVYGNDEQLNQVFKQAAAANDSKTVHLRLAAIFEESEKHEKADEQYKRACKKFGSSSKVWTLAGAFYFRRGNLEAARDLLKKCILSLDKRKHLKTISKFAQLEYKLGDAERGKTIFEGIADSHPKRSDLWSVYVDMETARENIQGVRSIFDRLFVLKLTSHKAKFFFKKWLAVEKRIGDEDGEDVVKAKAIEWTRKANESS